MQGEPLLMREPFRTLAAKSSKKKNLLITANATRWSKIKLLHDYKSLSPDFALQTVRQKLYDEISKINKDRDWSFILKQIGEAYSQSSCSEFPLDSCIRHVIMQISLDHTDNLISIIMFKSFDRPFYPWVGVICLQSAVSYT